MATGIACGVLFLVACACSRREADSGAAFSGTSGGELPTPVANSTPQPPQSSGARPAAGQPVHVAVELEAEDPMPGGQFVLVENPSDASIDLGCWSLRLDAAEPAMIIPRSFSLPSGATARLFGTLPEAGRVELVDPGGLVIDRTPQLSDTGHDDRMWFRTADSWRFGRLSDPLQDVVDTTLQPPTAAAC